ncbi:hypothetical protein HPB51_013797 [Rhipicephalus microplus]|uniref:PiggyBac transposable element-derived protein domain-containing protein n=1 Tax=Rhipicephalus microplus TaxID=6941 RepID=A0A9J6F3K7_RHIMP|nr:hypothetical protein HPB51_013797 [Rhipicephalus microplus]
MRWSEKLVGEQHGSALDDESPISERAGLSARTHSPITSLSGFVKAATLNVRGLASRKKQTQLYRLAMDQDLDIIAVQETKVESVDATESLLQRFTGRYTASVSHEVDDEDDSDKASKVPSKKPRKWDKVDIPKMEVPEKNHDPVYEVKPPYACCTYMFTDKLVELITIQTNLYGTQEQGNSIATSAEQIRRFLGILALMGV